MKNKFAHLEKIGGCVDISSVARVGVVTLTTTEKYKENLLMRLLQRLLKRDKTFSKVYQGKAQFDYDDKGGQTFFISSKTLRWVDYTAIEYMEKEVEEKHRELIEAVLAYNEPEVNA